MAYTANVEVDVKSVEEAFERMDPKNFKGAVRKSLRQGANIVKKSISEEVAKRYPGTSRHLPDHETGMHFWWHKGKNITQYGELKKDVKLGVWKSAKGAFVTLAPNKKNSNRGALLNWLNNGTNRRGNERSSYMKVKGNATRRTRYQFVSAGGTKSLGQLPAKHFFGTTAEGASFKASEKVAELLTKNVISAFNKENKPSD